MHIISRNLTPGKSGMPAGDPNSGAVHAHHQNGHRFGQSPSQLLEPRRLQLPVCAVRRFEAAGNALAEFPEHDRPSNHRDLHVPERHPLPGRRTSRKARPLSIGNPRSSPIRFGSSSSAVVAGRRLKSPLSRAYVATEYDPISPSKFRAIGEKARYGFSPRRGTVSFWGTVLIRRHPADLRLRRGSRGIAKEFTLLSRLPGGL